MRRIDRPELGSELLGIANELFYGGRFEECVQVLTRAVVVCGSRDPQVYCRRAEAYLRVREYDKAIHDYNIALRYRSNFKTYSDRAWICQLVGKHEQAIRDATKAIELNPAASGAFFTRGLAYGSMGQHQEAVHDYDEALQLSETSDAYCNRGLAHAAMEDYESAVVDFTSAIDLDEKASRAVYSRGLAYYRLRRFAESIEDFTRAIDLNPRLLAAYYSRGMSQHAMENIAEALKDYTHVIDMAKSGHQLEDGSKPLAPVGFEENGDLVDARVSAAYYNRGMIHSVFKRNEAAIEDMLECLRLQPTFAPAYNDLGLALTRLSRFDEAMDAYTKGIDLDPSLPTPSYNRGYLQFIRQAFQRALEDFTHVIEVDPNHVKAISARAMIYCRLDMPKEALADFVRAFEIEPPGFPNLVSLFDNCGIFLDFYKILSSLELNNATMELRRIALDYIAKSRKFSIAPPVVTPMHSEEESNETTEDVSMEESNPEESEDEVETDAIPKESDAEESEDEVSGE